MGTVPETKVRVYEVEKIEQGQHLYLVDPDLGLRVYEVEKIEQGQHLYLVAVQLDATNWKKSGPKAPDKADEPRMVSAARPLFRLDRSPGRDCLPGSLFGGA